MEVHVRISQHLQGMRTTGTTIQVPHTQKQVGTLVRHDILACLREPIKSLSLHTNSPWQMVISHYPKSGDVFVGNDSNVIKATLWGYDVHIVICADFFFIRVWVNELLRMCTLNIVHGLWWQKKWNGFKGEFLSPTSTLYCQFIILNGKTKLRIWGQYRSFAYGRQVGIIFGEFPCGIFVS